LFFFSNYYFIYEKFLFYISSNSYFLISCSFKIILQLSIILSINGLVAEKNNHLWTRNISNNIIHIILNKEKRKLFRRKKWNLYLKSHIKHSINSLSNEYRHFFSFTIRLVGCPRYNLRIFFPSSTFVFKISSLFFDVCYRTGVFWFLTAFFT
jgi:hypothetical protein